MTKIISISLTKEQSDFLSEKKISPSGIFQEKVIEIMQRFKQFEKFDARIQSLQDEAKVFYRYLEQISKFEDFLKWRRDYVLESKQ